MQFITEEKVTKHMHQTSLKNYIYTTLDKPEICLIHS